MRRALLDTLLSRLLAALAQSSNQRKHLFTITRVRVLCLCDCVFWRHLHTCGLSLDQPTLKYQTLIRGACSPCSPFVPHGRVRGLVFWIFPGHKRQASCAPGGSIDVVMCLMSHLMPFVINASIICLLPFVINASISSFPSHSYKLPLHDPHQHHRLIHHLLT